VCPENLVPSDEEGLREVVLVAIELVVYVMVSTVVVEEHMEEIAREPQSTMIVDCLDCSEGEEEDGSSRGHAGDEEGESPAHGV